MLAVPRRLMLPRCWLLSRCCRDLLQSDPQPSRPRPLIAPVTFKVPRCCQQLVPTLRPVGVPRLCINMIRIQYPSTRQWCCHCGGYSSPFVFCRLQLPPPPQPPLHSHVSLCQDVSNSGIILGLLASLECLPALHQNDAEAACICAVVRDSSPVASRPMRD